jgi:hypothetical protein
MPMIENETLTRIGNCPTHGRVTAEKLIPKLKFPFFVTGIARAAAQRRPYRCRECGAKVA